MNKIIEILTKEFDLKKVQVVNTLNLLDEGNTIPFIARYRKEVTGNLSDEILRKLYDRLEYLKNLEERKKAVINLIDEQDKLTDKLKEEILNAQTLVRVEDLYLPYKKKRKTRGVVAKEKGLEPLALEMLLGIMDLDKYKDIEEPLEGAKDIIAEMVSDNADIREYVRNYLFNNAFIVTEGKLEEENSTYKIYYDYKEKVKDIVSHRVLAINRGEKEKELGVKLDFEIEPIYTHMKEEYITNLNSHIVEIEQAIEDSFKRLIYPSIEREIRNELTKQAQENAIEVFSKNLHQLLMSPPVYDKVVLAIDPAFRTGCKIAVINENSNVVDTNVIYPVEPHNKIEASKKILDSLIKKHKVDVIVIGNGTASRETERFVSDYIKDKDILYTIVNEAGASVYSASKIAREEFKDFDVSLRSAVSIGRRFQDALSELVKIDPKSIGVGQYQHDMNQTRLSDVLGGVVETCVNNVGVDLNNASASLLSYVSGITTTLSNNIVNYRLENKKFSSRKELLKVTRLGPKAYEQAAGFLRIKDSTEPLDNTSVHPESYDVTKKLLKKLDVDILDLSNFSESVKDKDLGKLSEELNVGKLTLIDIVNELKKPGRDPRENYSEQILRSDILDIKDLSVGLKLQGTVRNVIDFGAFVDIGVGQDGLVHISKLANKFVKHPLDIVSVGDVIEVEVIDIDSNRNRISLKKVLDNKKESK